MFSVHRWTTLRIEMAGLLLYVASLALIATKLDTVDAVTLILVLKWTTKFDYLEGLLNS